MKNTYKIGGLLKDTKTDATYAIWNNVEGYLILNQVYLDDEGHLVDGGNLPFWVTYEEAEKNYKIIN